MNIAEAVTMGVLGMVSGWLIPLAASKAAEYKLHKNGETPAADPRFTSPILKLLCLVLNGALWTATGLFSEDLLYAFLLAVILLDAAVITIVDIRIHLVPNEAVLIMSLAGLILQIGFNGMASLIGAVISALVVMVVFVALGSVLGFNTIGAGDVKLAGAMGLALGWPLIMYALIGMSAILLIWCLGGLITKKLKLDSMLAFAPFMMAGTVFAIVAGITGS